jgi:hypothetical protein
VFGVPTYVLDGDSFWGREHLEYIAHRLEKGGYSKAKYTGKGRTFEV